MCGIAGIYCKKEDVYSQLIKTMTDTIRHRGPDDEGFFASRSRTGETYHLTGSDSKVEGQRIEAFSQPVNLFMGHRRLSILDPSPLGHQPMSNQDRTLWLVYNGEIYNYIELREELKFLGHRFKTNTDSEVLLAAYEEWGEKCLDKFNGMWAFVIYDLRKKILFGARDRFGVKPLYYSIDSNHFSFSSEIKALVKLPFVKKKINPKAVFDYLVLALEENSEECFFENIFQLQPSFAFHYDINTNNFKKWQYYSLRYTSERESFSETTLDTHVLKTKELVSNAISLRLRSDVLTGSCLSGGIDSSSIVCTINDMLKAKNLPQVGNKQKVFTAIYDLQAIDESMWAKMVVEQTQTQWFQTSPTAEGLLDDLTDLVYAQDIPFASTSLYAQYQVMKLARENGVKVLLDGQGADELFAGYRHYYGTFFLEMLKHGDIAGLRRESGNLDNSPIRKSTLLLSLIKLAALKVLPPRISQTIAAQLEPNRLNNYLQADFLAEHQERLSVTKKRAATSLNEKLHDDFASSRLRTLLRYEDRNSMNFSIESRTPFADDINLIEYIFQIPSVYKIHNGWSKHLLREATAHVLPEKIKRRKDKVGFATPEQSWLNANRNELKYYITNKLSDFLDVKKIKKEWDVILDDSQPNVSTMPIWRCINLGIWKNVYGL